MDALLQCRTQDALAVLGLLPGITARGYDERYVSGREAEKDLDIEQEGEMNKYYKKRNCEPRPCNMCGAVFTPTHGNAKQCPSCREKQGKLRFEFPITYSNPVDAEKYEYKLRKRNIESFRDTIVAEGYAARQIAESLKLAGKVRTEL